MPPAMKSNRCLRFHKNSGWDVEDGQTPVEAVVSLTVNGEAWLSFHCSPTDLEALAAGFLFNEGIISKREEVALITLCDEGRNVDVWLSHAASRPEKWQRTSGCMGEVTSVSLPESIALTASESTPIDPQALLSGMEQLAQRQALFHQSGGVHGSAVSDGITIRALMEDIGRHNTIDKLAGRLLLDGVDFHPMILLTTGRVSLDMLQKAHRMGAEVVVSRNSATSKAAAMADRLGVTLAGYARSESFKVYACPERLVGAEALLSDRLARSSAR